MIAVKNTHKHIFGPVADKKVLLAKFRNEEGKPNYQGTTGADLLKQRKCVDCGKVETYDLTRIAS